MKRNNTNKNMTILSCLFMTFIFTIVSNNIQVYAAVDSGVEHSIMKPSVLGIATLNTFIGENFNMENPALESLTAVAYHKHSGSSQGGGCYTNPSFCGGRMEERSRNPHGCGISASGGGCAHCGCWYEAPSAKYPSGCAHCNCPKPKTVECVICGKEGGSGTCSRINNYSLNCGQGETTPLASISLKKSTQEWTRELMLEASYQILSPGITVGNLPYNWNNQGAVEKNQFSVSQNGIYTCQLNLPDNGNLRQAKASVTVNRIDKKAPDIKMDTFDNSIFVKEQVIAITAEDLQEDGSLGSGLHSWAYSFDGGGNWQESNTFAAKENKSYCIQARDVLENISQLEITLSNIDTTPPKIEVKKQESMVTIAAIDLQADGTEGVGLHTLPYSFDGGKTWTTQNTCEMKTAGEYKLFVRDALDNTESEIMQIEERKQEGKAEEKEIESTVAKTETTEIPETTIAQETQKASQNPKNKRKEASIETEITETETAEEIQVIVKKEIAKVLTEKPKEKIQSEQKKEPKINAELIKAVTVAAIITMLLCILFLLLYLWIFIAKIYTITDKNTLRLIGMALIRKDEGYCICLSEDLIERSESIFCKIRMNPLFVKRHRLEMLLIKTEESKTAKEITENIDIILS